MTILATYKDGAFVPDTPVSLPNGARVEVLVPLTNTESEEKLRRRFPEVAGTLPQEDAEEIRRIIEEEFRKVDHDDWR